MRKSVLVFILAGLVMGFGGCVVIDVKEESGSRSYPKDDTVAEIDAVGKLSFENTRQKILKAVSERGV